MDKVLKRRRLSSFQIIILGFLSVILIGTVILMLPISTRGASHATFMEALFTATSATCVTGLVLQDTVTYWSPVGQCIILILIQIGGMGVVTLAALVTMASGRKIGLMQRSTMQEAIAAHSVGGIVRLTNFILKFTFLIELSGAILLLPVFYKDFGLIKGIWYAVFHSISAFCNAGFDLMGSSNPFSSLTAYQSNAYVNIIIILLIVVGGIGFLTWEDISSNKWNIRNYRMQTKVIFIVTSILLILPFLFYYSELSMYSGKQRVLSALFQSVTPRTAGFNTIDLNILSESGIFLMIVLMMVGGSPGSTAGGMKTTTLAVLLAHTIAVFRRKEDVNFFGRRLYENAIRFASAIFMLYLVLSITGACIISKIENLPLLKCLFETTSAIGTVGLSLGITGQLCTISKCILICLMFIGRVGGLTLIFAATSGTGKNISRYPKGKLTVG